MYKQQSCKWNEISDSYHEMQTYNGIITLITLHVINNLLAQKWPPMLSERAVYTEMELNYRLQQILFL
jgi:hypothetical protein